MNGFDSDDNGAEIIIPERAKNRAVNALNTRALSRGEMRERLIKLGETENVAENVADWCVRMGLIDDAEYARAIVRGVMRRGYGLRRARDEFFKRRVPRDLWDDILAEFAEENDDVPEAAVAFIERKLGGETPDYAEKRRIGAALARRGFSWDEINAAFGEYAERLDAAL